MKMEKKSREVKKFTHRLKEKEMYVFSLFRTILDMKIERVNIKNKVKK